MDKTRTVKLPTPGKKERETSGDSLDPLIHGDTSGRSLFLDSLIFVLEHGCGDRPCEVRSLQNKNLE